MRLMHALEDIVTAIVGLVLSPFRHRPRNTDERVAEPMNGRRSSATHKEKATTTRESHDLSELKSWSLTDASVWLAGHLKTSETSARRALDEALAGGRPAMLSALERVECALERQDAGECRFTVTLSVRDEKQSRIGRTHRDVPWEVLSHSVRREFIFNGNQPQRFLVYPN